MDYKKLKQDRKLYNNLIIEKLFKILIENDLRFNQLIYLINGTKDYFNEEPKETYKRICKLLNDK